MNDPPAPAIGVSAIVFDRDERVLLVRRGRPPARGQWHPPGGRLEPGESLTEACRREVREETGLDVTIGPIMAVVERRTEGFHYIIVDFLAALQDPERTDCHPDDDVVAAVWSPYERLSEFDIADGLLPILERARRAQRGEDLGLKDISGKGSDFIPMPWGGL